MNYVLLLMSAISLGCPPELEAQSFANPPLSSVGYISPSQLYQVQSTRLELQGESLKGKDCSPDSSFCSEENGWSAEALFLNFQKPFGSYGVGTRGESSTIRFQDAGRVHVEKVTASAHSGQRITRFLSIGASLDLSQYRLKSLSPQGKGKADSTRLRPTLGLSLHGMGAEASASYRVIGTGGAETLRDPASFRMNAQLRPLAYLAVGTNYELNQFDGVSSRLLNESLNTLYVNTSGFGMSLELSYTAKANPEGSPGRSNELRGMLHGAITEETLLGIGLQNESYASRKKIHESVIISLVSAI